MPWYAIQTRSNFEQRVSSEILRKPEVVPFFPCFQELRRSNFGRKRELVNVPLFRGYLFARFEDDPRQRLAVLSTIGVARILGHGQQIEAIPDSEIEALRRLMSSPAPIHPHPQLKPGAWVRMKHGPLEGIEGTLVRVKNSHRLVVAVDLLRAGASTEVDIADVEILKSVGSKPAPRR